MKNEPLTGYLLHARAYQEKRAIYTFFSREHGVVAGVGARGAPLFVPMSLFATGKNALKSFSQITPISPSLPRMQGQSQYALLYLNEILCRLIAPEMPCPQLYAAYEVALSALLVMGDDEQLKMTLRRFEVVLFDELGVLPSFDVDSAGEMIDVDALYRFDPTQGFVPTDDATSGGVRGAVVMALSDAGDERYLREMGQIHRQILDGLLEHKPLNSRKLWQQSLKYKNP